MTQTFDAAVICSSPRQMLENIAVKHNIPLNKIYLGSGYPISEPHIVYRSTDGLSGEQGTYNVMVYPKGSTGQSTDESIYYNI